MRSTALLGLLLALGCAGRATSVAEVGGASSASGGTTGGSAGSTSASAGAGGNVSAGAFGQGPGPCAVTCPAPFFGLHLAVNSSGGRFPLTGVQATLSGPATIELSCNTQIDTTLCFPTMGGPEGSYSLQVTAPGFQSVTVAATVTFAPGPGCGCATATLQPTGVILFPLAP